MYAAKRRKMLQFLMSRVRPRCSLSDIIDKFVSPGQYNDYGRGMDECEIHIDGNMFFWVAGAVGAGLAFITYQAILTKGRRRRRDTTDQSVSINYVQDLIMIGTV